MPKKITDRYVVHFCPNCDNCVIAEDKTRAKDRPPTWRLCPECCAKLGIDYNKQSVKHKNEKSIKNLKNVRDNDSEEGLE